MGLCIARALGTSAARGALEIREHEESIFSPHGTFVPPGPAVEPERYWTRQAECARSCAAFAYAFHDPVARIHDYLAQSNRYFETGIDRLAPFPLGAVKTQLAVALVMNDQALAERLCNLDPARCQVEGVTLFPIVPREFAVWKALFRGRDDEVRAALQVAEAGLATDKLHRVARGLCESNAALMKALLADDATAFNDALETLRAKAFEKTWRQASSGENSDGYMDLEGLALAGLARRRGLAVETDSVYFPLNILVD